MEAFTRTILSLPEALLELLVIGVAIAGFVALHAWLQRRLRIEILRRHNDVAGYLFSAVGVLYAVVLGFVVVVVWQKYDSTVSNVENEVDSLADVYHSLDAFGEPIRSATRTDLQKYPGMMIRVEWPAMGANIDVPPDASALLERVSHRIDMYEPKNYRGFAAQQAALRNMQRLFDARRERLIHAVPSVPSVLWFALVMGALAMVAFCYIFGVENRPAQLMMTGILVGLIGILFFVIGEFSTPFSGSVKISPDGWVYLQQHLALIP